jgi:hypothetical protein
MAAEPSPPFDDLPDNIRALIRPAAAKLRHLENRRTAREVATALVHRANQRAANVQRLRGHAVEIELERCEAEYQGLLERARAALEPAGIGEGEVALAVACLYAHQSKRTRFAEPDQDAIVARAQELYFLTPTRAAWDPLFVSLQRRPERQAHSELVRTLCTELRPRTPETHMPMLRAAADEAAKYYIQHRHGRLIDPGTAATLPRQACLRTWRELLRP